LGSDRETCRKIGETGDRNSPSEIPANLGKHEMHTIDSLFAHYMKFYNFHIDYSFDVMKPAPATASNAADYANYIYNKLLGDPSGTSGFELKLSFPEKKQYIIAEMGTMFITSVILILVVMILFWRTVLSLMKEKKISEHTTDFLNNMTHEFKTPLTNIALAGRMMIKDSSMQQEEKIKHYSAIILEENEKLRLQVEQVLGMTALERGEIPLRKTELDVHVLLRDVAKSLGLQIENRKGSLNLNLDAERFVIMGDQPHLANAFSNLIDNAIKYSPGKPDLSVHTFNSDSDLIITVSDKGLGIEKEFQKKVFDKFFRVPTGDVHDVKGFGLGLAYTKTIIELHGGTIEIQSENNKSSTGLQQGTTFTITLPNA